jgi:hypothetical protein
MWGPIPSFHIVILSAAETSRSEVPAQSKDPCILHVQQKSLREFSPCTVWDFDFR